MNMNPSQESVAGEKASLEDEDWAPHMPRVLHTLSNKLLPIVAFSDLGSRRCEDPTLREYFEKIRQAAGDSRELIIQLRQEIQQRKKAASENHELPPDSL
jgi:hypothetical protein